MLVGTKCAVGKNRVWSKGTIVPQGEFYDLNSGDQVG